MRETDPNPTPQADWQRRPLIRLAYSLVKRLEYLVGRYSPDGDRVFFEPADFQWVRPLEENWLAIRSELDSLLEHRDRLPNFQDISKDQITITQDDHWKTFFLYGYGYRQDKNCALCPMTAQLVEQVPGMLTAFFSILSPGKHIPPHRGPYKGILRYHLGLLIPNPGERCRLRVDQEYRTWKQGESLLFDDTYEHEVWNDTDGLRAILFLDVMRRLPVPVASLNRLIVALIRRSSFIQDARKNADQFDLDQVFANPRA